VRILLDTHYLIWSFTNPEKIDSGVALALVDDSNQIFYSQVSLWEISIKFNTGKLVLNGMRPEEFYDEIEQSHFECKRLENDELISFHQLPIEHRDPFDRMLIWQSINNDLLFLSVDSQNSKYERYGLKTLNRV
jgi:PIN domain nuclease of toxin-antitoxin system